MKIYRVGGSVRDELLGLEVTDQDFVVEGSSPAEMLSKGFHSVGKSFPVFLHPKTKDEYALARTERKTGLGYHGFTFDTNSNVTIEDDLSRRDLTINAIALDDTGKIIDPFNGVADLNNKILRHIGEAFAEDPLRLFRVARFYAKFAYIGFIIADDTYELMKKLAGEIKYLSKERIWMETEKALSTSSPHLYFETLERVGVLDILLERKITLTWNLSLKNLKLSIENQELINFLSILIDFETSGSDIIDTLNSFEKFLAIPNKNLEYAKLTAKWLSFFKLPNINKEELFLLANKSDFKRKPEKIALILQVLEHYPTQTQNLTNKLLLLAKAYQSLQIDINLPKDLIIKSIETQHKSAINDIF